MSDDRKRAQMFLDKPSTKGYWKDIAIDAMIAFADEVRKAEQERCAAACAHYEQEGYHDHWRAAAGSCREDIERDPIQCDTLKFRRW